MMTKLRIADLIGKDVTGIRGDVRGGRYPEFGPLVRTLTKVERRMERCTPKRPKEPWVYLLWTIEPREDGVPDCGYSGWQEEHFNGLDPVVIVDDAQ